MAFSPTLLAGLSFACLAVCAFADEAPMLNGQPIEPAKYKLLQEDGQLPLVAEMSDIELTQKLNLDHPALAEAKSAVAQNNAAGLQKALGAYLHARLGALAVKPTGKPASNAALADKWLQNEVEYAGIKFPWGANVNWWIGYATGRNGEFVDFGPWLHPVQNAFEETGDPRYAQAILDTVRSFYHGCRPPRKPRWGGPIHLGLWAPLQVSGRVHGGYLPTAYRYIGNLSTITDADRVMLLKMYWEATDFCYRMTDERSPHNIEVSVLGALVNISLQFPEYADSPKWRARAAQRFGENMHDCVLDDGGAVERTGYHFAYLGPYLANYKLLKNAGTVMPELFSYGLANMVEWTMWMLAPTLEYPLFGHGGLGPMDHVMQHGVDIFPDRKDFAYSLSGGQTGQPPERVARTLWHTGRATMRSDWSREAQYLALCFNLPGYGPAFSGEDHLELLSFGLWANGKPVMTNPGSTANYSTPEYDQWCTPTISDNTVVVNQGSSERFDGCGRLENWASVPDSGDGFTYVAAVGDGYRRFGVRHRRAVLFVRPSYWLVYDVLGVGGKAEKPGFIPAAGIGTKWETGQPCELSWLGHFQPTELTVDERTKTVGTAPADEKRFWLVPARPESLQLDQKSTPIIARKGDNAPQPLNPSRAMGRTIALTKSDVTAPTAFTVLLCPADAGASAPQIESLRVMEGKREVADAGAIGCRISHGKSTDVVAMTTRPALRTYGPLTTDAETAYVRLEGDRVIEAGMSGGKVLEYAGKRLLEAGSEIIAARVTLGAGAPVVHAEGRGKVVARGRTRVTFGKTGTLTLENLQLSVKPEDVLRAIGVPGMRDAKDTVAVTWQTAAPADARVEYRKAGDSEWTRTINPEPLREHRFALSRLENGQTYQLRIMSRSEDGLPGTMETTYTHKEEHVALSK